EAGDQFLRLREGAIDDGPLGAGESDACALRTRVEPFAREHHAGLHQLFVELSHRGQQLLVRHHPRLRVLGGLDYRHESHRGLSSLFRVASRASASGLYLRDERTSTISTGPRIFLWLRARHPTLRSVTQSSWMAGGKLVQSVYCGMSLRYGCASSTARAK